MIGFSSYFCYLTNFVPTYILDFPVRIFKGHDELVAEGEKRSGLYGA